MKRNDHIETSIYFCLKYLSTIIAPVQTIIPISGLLFCTMLLAADITNMIAKTVDVISVAISITLIIFNRVFRRIPITSFLELLFLLCYNHLERG